MLNGWIEPFLFAHKEWYIAMAFLNQEELQNAKTVFVENFMLNSRNIVL
jgi:hypothetical protein